MAKTTLKIITIKVEIKASCFNCKHLEDQIHAWHCPKIHRSWGDNDQGSNLTGGIWCDDLWEMDKNTDKGYLYEDIQKIEEVIDDK